MFFKNLFDVDSNFHKENELKETVLQLTGITSIKPESVRLFNFFKTSKQRTYLVKIQETVLCVLDDARRKKVQIKWKEDVDYFANTELTFGENESSTLISAVNFGQSHKNWLFSREIFPSNELFNKKFFQFLNSSN